jgi:hypothetical protein
LDGLEEARALSLIEINFRKIVQKHLNKLLEAKQTYWRQRATIHFVEFGEENTKLFHTLATHSKRKNHIGQLVSSDGNCLVKHHDKAKELWASFKNRLGTSEFKQIFYDLDSLILPKEWPELDSPFSDEEVSLSLKEMPYYHAPGPDGFNGCIMKKCWSIIQSDF